MIDFDYVLRGLQGLSRAHHVNTMAGHLGAAVVTGYFIAEQHPDLDPVVYRGIEGDLDRIIRGESVFSPKKNSKVTVAEMFAPYKEEKPDESLVDGIAEALVGNIDETRQSGHNVIFAAIAVRALVEHPEFATPSLVEGIRKLILKFDGVTSGNGNFGKEKGRIDGRKIDLPDDENSFPPYTTLESMADVVLDTLIRQAPERRQGFGGLTHINNHAAALVELAQYGYPDLAIRGLQAHHQHMRLWRTLPDLTEEIGAETAAEHDPRSAAYWRNATVEPARAQLTHRVKTIYGFDTLVELVDDEAKEWKANEALRYLM